MQLDGVRVLDLTRLLPGPYGTQMLADMGAEVIKIEPPGIGDYAREMEPKVDGTGSVFASTHRGKKSVTLNLKTDEGTAIFYDMVADADVVFEQFRPGVVDRLGVAYEDVREHNSDIVYCSLSGYGQTGPYSDRVGHDLNYVGLTGLLDMTRRKDDDTPSIPGYPIADMVGGLFGAFTILGALLARELGNGGEYIDVSMTDAVMSLSHTITPLAATGGEPRPGETPLTGQFPSYDVYETADDRYVVLAALEVHFWEEFCAAVGREDLMEYHHADDPAVRAEVRSELESLFRSRTRDEWMADLGDQEVMVSPVLTPTEALEDSQIQSRNLVNDGAPPRIGFPARTSDERHTDEHVPELGEHTREVLREYGYDDFDALDEDGVI